jgi:hypothetical protein
VHLECLYRVPVVRGDEHDQRHCIEPDLLDDLEGARPPEVDVEKHDVGLPLANRRDRFVASAALSAARHAVQLRELAAQTSPSHRFIIDDEHLHRGVSRKGMRISTRVPRDWLVPLAAPRCTEASGP